MNLNNNSSKPKKSMTLSHLIAREITQRKSNFVSACLAVTAAVAVFVGAMTMLRVHDQRTEDIIIQKEKNTRARMAQLKDDYRVITKGLGFNLLILPQAQELSQLYAEDYATHFMPENYVTRLAESKIVTIRHLLPSLQQKVWWPETKRTIILFGTRGEVPFVHRAPKEPMLFPVPAGQAVLGYELHQSLGLKSGDLIKILGESFTVTKCNSRRGNKDDITIWIDLKQAQELLSHVGEISGILALKCLCVGTDLAKVRSEITEILPGVQVIEQSTRVVARAEARHRAAAEAEQAIAAERKNRAELRAAREQFTAILVPVVLLLSGVWLMLLFFSNVRERRFEIGLLRAIGFSNFQVLVLFLGKALLIGLIGGFFGYVIGFLFGIVGTPFRQAFDFLEALTVGTAFGMATLLAVLASWLPAMQAISQDPAEILKDE